MLLLLAAGGLWWWTGSEGSLAWMLRQIARTQPLRAEGVRGSLRSGLHADRLQWQSGGLTIEALDVGMEWQPLDLITGALHLEQVHASAVQVQDRRPAAAPAAPPQSLELPLHAAVDALKVDRVEWARDTASFIVTDVAGRYSFNGSQHQIQVESLRWGAGSYRGRASVGARGALPVDATIEGRFQAPVPGSTAALALDFSATLQGALTDLQAKARLQVGAGSPAAGTRATATARVTGWAQQPLPQAQAQFQQLDAGALWPQAPHTSLAGEVSVQPTGTQTWSISADVANALPGPWDKGRLPVDKLNARGEWRASGTALVRSLQAQLGAGQLQAQGEWRGRDGWAVEGKLSRVDPAALYSAMATVPVSGSAQLHGNGSDISFDVALKAAGAPAPGRRRRGANNLSATVQALELREATARGRWRDGLLTLPAFDVRMADARTHGSLELRPTSRAGSGHVNLEAPGLQAAADGRLAETSGAGTFTLAAANLDEALRWAQRLPGAPALLQQAAASGSGNARVAWQGGWRDPALQARLTLPLLKLRSGASTGDAAIDQWTLRDASASVDGRLGDASVTAQGRAEQGQRRVGLELAGRGGRHSASPAVWQGRVDTLKLSASDPAFGGGTWSLALQRAFDLRWSPGSFDSGAGQATLAAPAQPKRAVGQPALLAWDPVRWRTGELRTAGRLTGLPMAWLELVGGPQLAGTALAGDMVFDAQWDASLGATPRLRASIARVRGDITVLAETAEGNSTRVNAGVREARLALESDGAALGLSLHWDTERGGMAAGQFATRLEPGGATGWRWEEDAPVSGVLRAQLPRIGVWSLLAPPGWRLRGSLAADVTLAGTRADPQFSGTVAADDLALRSVVDGVELQGGRLRARLQGRQLLVDEFLLRGAGGAQGGGTLVASGEGSWTQAGPQAQLTARITRLRASIRADRQLTVSGQLAARADSASSELTGTVTVDQARFVLPDENTPKLGDDVVVHGGAEPPTKAQAKAAEDVRPGARRVHLALDVNLGNDFQVQGKGIKTKLRGTLALAGESVTAPRVTGVIRTAGGEYQAYGQRLDIERGVLRFTGAADNPSLDILAVRPNLVQRVGVQITGTVLSPYVRLYSEPDMADADKLSWLVLGRAGANGGAEAALLQQAAIALLGSRSGRAGKAGIASSLGLDELSFRRDSPEGPAVTLGKRLGRNFYAAYERSLSGALGTLYVFYDLTRRVTVRAEAGTRTAVDLIFTFAFD